MKFAGNAWKLDADPECEKNSKRMQQTATGSKNYQISEKLLETSSESAV